MMKNIRIPIYNSMVSRPSIFKLKYLYPAKGFVQLLIYSKGRSISYRIIQPLYEKY